MKRRTPILLMLAALALFAATLLIGPRIPDSDQQRYCVNNIHLGTHFGVPLGFSLNCDSPEFLKDAADPALLLKENSFRQARPGLILLAHALSLPIRPLMGMLRHVDAGSLYGQTRAIDKQAAFLDWLPPYIGFVAANFLFVIAAFVLYLGIVRPLAQGSVAAPAIGLLLVFNDVVKAFLFSANPQILNVLVPVFCIWVFVQVAERGLFARPGIFVAAAVAGLGMSAYPTSIMFIPCALAPLPWVHRDRSWAWRIGRGAAVAAICVAPSLAWWALVKTVVGSFLVPESAMYREFIWVGDVSRYGVAWLIGELVHNAGIALRVAGTQGIVALALAALALVLLGRRDKFGATLGRASTVLVGCLFVAVLHFAFVVLVGVVVERLASLLVPILVVAAGAGAGVAEEALPARPRRALRIAAVCTVAGFGIFEAWKTFPIS